MRRQFARTGLAICALAALALVVQGCADRRYGRSAPAQATVSAPPQPAQPLPVTQPAPPPSPTPAPAAPAPEPAIAPPPAPQPVTAPPPAPQAETVAAPAQSEPAADAGSVTTSEEPDLGVDSRGRPLRAASNTAPGEPVGTFGGRPVFAVDEVPEDVAQKLEEYRMGPGDRLQIKVFGQDEISGEFEISAAGELSYPLIGQITAENMTPGEFNNILTEALKEFFVNPQVTVEITNYRPFFILGQVGNPGSYKYQPGLNARMAIAVGGGYTRRAKEEPITIFRVNAAGELIKFDADQDVVILPGDTIEVHRRLF
jgi:polysaccharide export outer membrane protein